MDDSLDMQVSALVRLMRGAPLHREVYVRILEYCKERRELSEVEDAVMAMPESKLLAQSPYSLIRCLVDEGGLEWLDLDESGAPIDPALREKLTEDEYDDMVASYAVETTASGADASELMSPASRLGDLLESAPDRSSAFLDVLSFCETPRKRVDIETFLEGCGILDTLRASNGQPLKASYFVDMLERSGSLVWDGAWQTTPSALEVVARAS